MISAHWTFEAIGTKWDIACEVPDETPSTLVLSTVKARIAAFDAHYSRFRTDSLVHRISKQAGTYQMPEDWELLWNLYRDLYRLTGGTVTPLIGSMLEDYGYDANYSFIQKELRPLPPLEVLSYEAPHLHASIPVLIDIGAAGKGYAVDIVGELLAAMNISSFTINAGGDVLHRGSAPLLIGLEDPRDAAQAVGKIEILNMSICGSAGNRRRFTNSHHIINPHTGKSPDHIEATWAVAQHALLADGLATALYFVEPEVLEREYRFDWAILYSNRSVRFSQMFEHSFFE